MPPQLDSGMFERLPFDCAMFDGKVDIPEYKVDDVDGETLPKIRAFRIRFVSREALGIKWIRSVLCALHLYLYFCGHTWSKIHIW